MDVDLLTGQERRRQGGGLAAAVAVVSLAGVVVALTVLFLGMRSVMEVGGACGSGGPYVINTPCPDGVAPLIALSIPLGVILVLVHAVAAMRAGAPSVALLAWPALFLSLGWNFWEYGLSPPDGSGTAWGWVICGVVFVIMGAVPLFGLVSVARTAWSSGDAAMRGRVAWYVVYAITAIAAMVLGTLLFDAVTT